MNAETENEAQDSQASDATQTKANDTSEAKAEDANKDENSSCCGTCSS